MCMFQGKNTFLFNLHRVGFSVYPFPERKMIGRIYEKKKLNNNKSIKSKHWGQQDCHTYQAVERIVFLTIGDAFSMLIYHELLTLAEVNIQLLIICCVC